MKLYDEQGYFNFEGVRNLGLPLSIICGGRGTGKTYGAIKSAVYDNPSKFIFMRRQQTQVDVISSPEFSPFTPVAHDMGKELAVKAISKNCYGVYETGENQDGELVAFGSPLGYCLALSTFSNLRGFDASEVDILILDEFIPETHERGIKAEGDALANVIETINRNREIKGCKPLQVFLLANANNLANDIFVTLGIVAKVAQMKEKGQECSINKELGLGIFLLEDSPISKKKRETAFYKIFGGGNFAKMALDNDFIGFSGNQIKSCSLREFSPLVAVGELTIYESRGNRDKIYVSTTFQPCRDVYTSSTNDLRAFKLRYRWLFLAHLERRVWFENATAQVLFEKYFETR